MELNPKVPVTVNKLKGAIAHKIDIYTSFSEKATKQKIFLPLIENHVLSDIVDKLLTLKEKLGVPTYLEILGDKAIQIGTYLDQRIRLLSAYEQSLKLSETIKESIQDRQKESLADSKFLQQAQIRLTKLKLIQKNFRTRYNLEATHNIAQLESDQPLKAFNKKLKVEFTGVTPKGKNPNTKNIDTKPASSYFLTKKDRNASVAILFCFSRVNERNIREKINTLIQVYNRKDS